MLELLQIALFPVRRVRPRPHVSNGARLHFRYTWSIRFVVHSVRVRGGEGGQTQGERGPAGGHGSAYVAILGLFVEAAAAAAAQRARLPGQGRAIGRPKVAEHGERTCL